MKDATVRYGSVDWASQKHSACVVDGDGQVVDELEVAHESAGLSALCRFFLRARVHRVSSRAVKALRTRYGLAGNKDDRSDAFVLADCLRTDGHRWPTLQPDSPTTVALRSAVRSRKDLVANRIATTNQLRANGYSGRTPVAELLGRLQAAPRGRHGAAAASQAEVTLVRIQVLRTLLAGIDRLKAQITEQLALHPDGFIFQSLPRSGTVRAAAMLAEIGDFRARFPTPDALACLAGAVPSTRSSGKHRVVTFRWSCDKKLRDALMDFAQDSRRGSPWAEHMYRRHRAQRNTHPHISRILARSWIDIIWRCWQDRVAYDPDRHRALQRVLAMEG